MINNFKNINLQKGSHFIKSCLTSLKWHIKDKCAPVDGSHEYSKGSHFIKSCLTSLKCSPEYSKGALLLELLIVISLLAIILSVGANATFLSMRSSKTSGENSVASSLAVESLEAVRSVAEEDFQNIYGLVKSTQHYYPAQLGGTGKWILSIGDEAKVLNGITYTRYVVINNVSRDSTTRNIESAYSSLNDDPSTQKVTAFVSWTGGKTVEISEYFFRWKNKICGQSGWVTGGSGDSAKICPDTTYDTKDPEIDISTGSIKLLPPQ